MQGKGFKEQFFGLTNGEPQPKPEPPVEEVEDPGPCAAIPKNRWVTALTIRHAKGPWESFQFQHIEVRSEFEPTRFVLGYSDQHDRFQVIVSGRSLLKIYTLAIQGRLEWIRVSDRPQFAPDNEPVIEHIEVIRVQEKRG